ncbi:ThiF family protein [Histomonas meleagridis]|uniref:ThiF family protein n=1 Tax=Histomonas meleagridis TaxID=135588 RepID=UPI003559535D|nr:ThiF family protein [Histomonas meleagridis]KAH0796188.1 ThiF family protein [Histomonas meleagridis]
MSKDQSLERYDRQIRLWGINGQQSIVAATLVVTGSDCVSSEFLKNMTLHGVKNVIIVDDALVTKDDLGTNFYVDETYLGKPRAQAVADLLTEMNPDAIIKPILKAPNDISFLDEIKQDKDCFIVTTGNQTPTFLKTLSRKCREIGIRQAHLQITGYFGAFYIDGGLHHFYEETKNPNNPIFTKELRMSQPFPELKAFFDSFDFDKLSEAEHGHIPYPVILYQAAELVKKELGVDKLSFSNLSAIQSQISKMHHIKIDAENNTMTEEECFKEALSKVMFILIPPTLPDNLPDCFSLSDKIGEVKSPFWEMIRATQRFYKKHGVIPHYGGCPDMETSFKWYQQLKEIYIHKSEEDWKEIREDLKSNGCEIDETIFERFKHNIYSVGGIEFKTIEEQIDAKSPNNKSPLAIVQMLFIAARQFLEKEGRTPKKGDEAKLLELMKEIGAKDDNNELTKYVEEFCRYNGDVIPSVAGSFAAVLAEEVTKIIIRQLPPADKPVVVDSIHSLLGMMQ